MIFKPLMTTVFSMTFQKKMGVEEAVEVLKAHPRRFNNAGDATER